MEYEKGKVWKSENPILKNKMKEREKKEKKRKKERKIKKEKDEK